MGSRFVLFAAAAAVVAACKPSGSAVAKEPSPVRDTVLTEGIRFCESTYPYRGGLLVANFGTETLDPMNARGKGYILYYKNGKTDTLIPPRGYLSAPKGMYERDGRLFVCDVNRVAEFRLDSPSGPLREVRFPPEDLFVNDLAARGDTLFISVTNTGRIYRLDLSDASARPALWAEVPGPNGLAIAEDGTMYVASYPADGATTEANVVYRIGDLRRPVPEKLFDRPGQYDGIALSSDGKTLYVTSWEPSGVFAFDMGTRVLRPLDLGAFQGPADMTRIGRTLYIPDLPASRVVVRNLNEDAR